MKNKFKLLMLGAITSLLLVACTSEPKEEPVKTPAVKEKVEEVLTKENDEGETVFKAFPFEAITYETFKRSMEFFERGQDVSRANEYKTLESFKDKNVVLVFYVSWCSFCQEEIPHIVELMEENKDKKDLEFVFMNMTNNEEGLGQITESIENLKIPTANILMDVEGAASKTYEVEGTPTNIFINKNQEIVSYNSGLLSKEEIQFVIDEMYK